MILDRNRTSKNRVPYHFFENFHLGTSHKAIEAIICPFDMIFDSSNTSYHFRSDPIRKIYLGPYLGPWRKCESWIFLKMTFHHTWLSKFTLSPGPQIGPQIDFFHTTSPKMIRAVAGIKNEVKRTRRSFDSPLGSALTKNLKKVLGHPVF